MVAPPADGGGRHGYGQSGVSADAVLLISRTTVIVRQMRTGASWKRLDMAVRMRERARDREGGGRPDQGSRGGAMAEKGESSPELVIKAI